MLEAENCRKKALVAWAHANMGCEIGELHFVMEATGIYHENLAT